MSSVVRQVPGIICYGGKKRNAAILYLYLFITLNIHTCNQIDFDIKYELYQPCDRMAPCPGGTPPFS